MALTPEQLPTFKADILANTNQVVIDALAAGANQTIADWYRQEASPQYTIYRRVVPAKEVSDAIFLENLEKITASKSAAVLQMFQIRTFDGGEFHGHVQSDREAFDNAFSAAAGNESQVAIAALWTRFANYAEKLFTVSGSGTTIDPAVTSFEGLVSSSDVIQALNS